MKTRQEIEEMMRRILTSDEINQLHTELLLDIRDLLNPTTNHTGDANP